MAVCPKCDKKLRLWHISQYCPYCGTNIVFHSFQPQFEKDRRVAEMSIGSFRVKLEKLKKAYVSALPQKLKIAACILPLAGLFVPFGNLAISSAIYEKKLTFWVLDMVYNAFMGEGYFSTAGALASDPVFGGVCSALKSVMLCMAVMALAAVGILLSELLCFAGNKRTGAVITAFSAVGVIASVAAKICCAKVASCSTGGLITASSNFLFVIPVLLFAFAAFSAVWALKNPPVYVFKEGDELRDRFYKEYKKGDIDIMDIPAPIYESEEDRLEKEKLIKGAYQMNDAEEVSSDG